MRSGRRDYVLATGVARVAEVDQVASSFRILTRLKAAAARCSHTSVQPQAPTASFGPSASTHSAPAHTSPTVVAMSGRRIRRR